MNVQYLEHPGTIHLTSKDISAPPGFDAGFLSHQADLSRQVWAYKQNREIIQKMSSFQSEYVRSQPSFLAGLVAACKVNDPYNTKHDDAAIEDWVHQSVETTSLFCTNFRGTCAMKPRDQGGVIDSYLNMTNCKSFHLSWEIHRKGSCNYCAGNWIQ